ncbi:penicillin-binding protein 2 [Pseudidiomarina taiwanensis]|uniref:Peptidoglycan D,D-transpeptidase MrdA n=1 Tax=Pseudidiomarina taiwanensis TaxID=337250 RepID=A0A432ZP06_9GAMM|nr:penicillin-binding protein 2 [Pseudidiomarina taiwanensis]RUO79645.1 penicillin-binding protein 2 [Pseudidiomarina taiwanensis]
MLQPRRTHIRDTQAEASLFGRRVWVAMAIVVLVFSILLSNLYKLQVSQFEQFQTRSNDNRIKVVPISPNRGLIYDRKGRLLAENVPVMSLEITPERVVDLDNTLARLQQLLQLDDKVIADFHEARRRERRFNQVILLDDLNDEQIAKLAVRQHEFPGVSIEARLVRSYPHGEAFTHALGYVAKINRRDLNALQERGQGANYAATRTIGKLGLERFYEDLLHGTVGYRQVEVDIHGRNLRTLSIEPPIPGQDLYLELDLDLQKFAYELLGDRRGSIVVIDPRDGGVLAMVSKPSYDPNWFVRGISYQQYQSLLQSKHSPLLNRSTQGGYPPASTIKPQIAVLGLEEGIIEEDTQIWDPGWFEIKGVDHRYRDWLSWGHGWVDVNDAIVESCDTFYYDLALKLGIDTISGFMSQFGFGETTGLDLFEESAAVMPSRGWKRARFNEPWYAGETVSIGIGQSYWTATPIQLAVATAATINRGKRVVPRLLGEIVDGPIRLPAVSEEAEPIILRDPSHWDVAIKGMNDVVDKVKGTAHNAFRGASYSSGGKTGTAQVISIGQDEEYVEEEIAEKFRDNAMYVGYAPQENPEIVVVFTVENAGGGGRIAAPKARELMDFYFEKVRTDADQ